MNEIADIFIQCIPPDSILKGDSLHTRNPGYCAASYDAGVLLRPANTIQLADICKLASANKIGLVAHGGLTGLVDGTASYPGQAIISFEKMNRILKIDPEQGIAVVEPGVTLAEIDDAVAEHSMMLGVNIPSRGSCTIGGMVATNAGGTTVIKYGMTRLRILESLYRAF